MARHDKLLDRIRQNPGSVRIGDLLTVLADHGVEIRPVTGSSHIVCKRGHVMLTVPRPHGGTQVRERYVWQALKLFDLECEAQDEDS